ATDRPEFPPFTVAGYFDSDHLEDLTAVVLQWTRSAEGVYVTINPPVPALLARCANRVRKQPKVTTGDAEINRRTGLVLDLDPCRPAKISATDEEKAAALERADAVLEFLTARGWPEPIRTDSGNGYHLRYRIDLPADDGGLVRRVLEALAARFDDDRV